MKTKITNVLRGSLHIVAITNVLRGSLHIVAITNKAERCTIGYRRVNRMVQVAVSYCAPDDKWKRNTGIEIVTNRLTWGANVISIPANFMSDESLQQFLQNTFFGFPEEV